jgi:hypothetical protein
MRPLIDLSGLGSRTPSRRTRAGTGKAIEVKVWIRAAYDLPPDTVVSVNEVRCGEPGCPDLETVVGVFLPGQPPTRLRFSGPLESLRAEDIVAASREIPL